MPRSSGIATNPSMPPAVIGTPSRAARFSTLCSIRYLVETPLRARSGILLSDFERFTGSLHRQP
jgi:hypothetical protein